MVSFRKTVIAAAIGGTLLATGSGVALLYSGGADAPVVAPAVPYTAGFAAAAGWDCTLAAPAAALSFHDRWSGLWDGTRPELTGFTWTSCSNLWADGYLTPPAARPSVVARRIDLSTLPLMR